MARLPRLHVVLLAALCFLIGHVNCFLPQRSSIPNLHLNLAPLQSASSAPSELGLPQASKGTQKLPLYNLARGAIAAHFTLDVIGKTANLRNLSYLSLLGALYSLLSEAEGRQRLDGNTFKLINTGLLVSLVSFFTFTSGALWEIITMGSCLGISGIQLKQFGVPKLKLKADVSENGNKLAILYLLTTIPSLIVAVQTIPTTIPILISMHLALHGAALAGPSRMASNTYQTLNTLLVAFHAVANILVSRSLKSTVSSIGLNLLVGLPVIFTVYQGKLLGLTWQAVGKSK